MPPPPQLLAQYADDEAWIVQRPVGASDNSELSENSELVGATTSSGEYTIRERSSDSSGNYQTDVALLNPATGSPDNLRVTSGASSGVATGLAVAVLSQSVPRASATAYADAECPVTQDFNWEGEDSPILSIFAIGCMIGWVLGLVSVGLWQLWCSRHMGQSSVQVSINNTVAIPEGPPAESAGNVEIPAEGAIRLPRAPRTSNGRRQRYRLFITAQGDCVHLTDQCTSLRGSQVSARTVCQRCAHFPLSLH